MRHLHYLGNPEELAVLLQAGFDIEALVGCTLREFLCMEMEICGDYANKRLQTIFVNSKAVDDFDRTVVQPGDVIALSGALPGLVGALMRRDGDLSGLRDSISYDQTELRPAETQGVVTIKLYNFIAEELAHIFLRRGVMVDGEHAARFLALGGKAQLDQFTLADGNGHGGAPLQELLQPGEMVRITCSNAGVLER